MTPARPALGLMAVAGLAVSIASCGGWETGPEEIPVSAACAEAWADYDAAVSDPEADETTAGSVVLDDCSTPAEWWAAGSPYVGVTFVRDTPADRDLILEDWCAAEEGPEPTVCAAR